MTLDDSSESVQDDAVEHSLRTIKSVGWNGVYEWKVSGLVGAAENYVMPEYIYSEPFEIDAVPWRILMYPNGNGVRYLSLYLDLANAHALPPGWSRTAQFSFTVRSRTNASQVVTHQAEKVFFLGLQDWGFRQFVPLTTLYEPELGFVQDDCLLIELNISISPGVSGAAVGYDSDDDGGSPRKGGLVGLCNQGATCYLNSLVQTLFHIPYWRLRVFEAPVGDVHDTVTCNSDDEEEESHSVGDFREAARDSENVVPLPDVSDLVLRCASHYPGAHDSTSMFSPRYSLHSGVDHTLAKAGCSGGLHTSSGITRADAATHSPSHGNSKDKERNLVAALQQVFYNLQFMKKAVSTRDLTKSFGWNQDDAFRQHDIHELFRVLCNSLEESLAGTKVAGAFEGLFKGKLSHVISCSDIDYESCTEEPFCDLQLNVKGCPTLQSALDAYFATELLEGDNKYSAPGHGLQTARRSSVLQETPSVLMLHLKRFGFDMTTHKQAKINEKQEFPETLDLSPYTTDPDQNRAQQQYTLFAVLVHSGDVNAGHYYAFLKPTGVDDSSNTGAEKSPWFRVDDERVYRVSAKDVMEENFGGEYGGGHLPRYASAYVLVYMRSTDLAWLVPQVTYQTIPQRVHSRFGRFCASRVNRHVDKAVAEAHLFASLRFVTDPPTPILTASSTCTCPVPPNPATATPPCDDLDTKVNGAPVKYLRKSTISALKKSLVPIYGMPDTELTLWKFEERVNGTWRPSMLLKASPDASLERALLLGSHHKDVISLYLHRTPSRGKDIVGWPGAGDDPVVGSSVFADGLAYVLFVKILEVKGAVSSFHHKEKAPKHSCKLGHQAPQVTRRYRFSVSAEATVDCIWKHVLRQGSLTDPTPQWIRVNSYEEVRPGVLETVHPELSVADLELGNGDIVVFAVASATPALSLAAGALDSVKESIRCVVREGALLVRVKFLPFSAPEPLSSRGAGAGATGGIVLQPCSCFPAMSLLSPPSCSEAYPSSLLQTVATTDTTFETQSHDTDSKVKGLFSPLGSVPLSPPTPLLQTVPAPLTNDAISLKLPLDLPIAEVRQRVSHAVLTQCLNINPNDKTGPLELKIDLFTTPPGGNPSEHANAILHVGTEPTGKSSDTLAPIPDDLSLDTVLTLGWNKRKKKLFYRVRWQCRACCKASADGAKPAQVQPPLQEQQAAPNHQQQQQQQQPADSIAGGAAAVIPVRVMSAVHGEVQEVLRVTVPTRPFVDLAGTSAPFPVTVGDLKAMLIEQESIIGNQWRVPNWLERHKCRRVFACKQLLLKAQQNGYNQSNQSQAQSQHPQQPAADSMSGSTILQKDCESPRKDRANPILTAVGQLSRYYGSVCEEVSTGNRSHYYNIPGDEGNYHPHVSKLRLFVLSTEFNSVVELLWDNDREIPKLGVGEVLCVESCGAEVVNGSPFRPAAGKVGLELTPRNVSFFLCPGISSLSSYQRNLDLFSSSGPGSASSVSLLFSSFGSLPQSLPHAFSGQDMHSLLIPRPHTPAEECRTASSSSSSERDRRHSSGLYVVQVLHFEAPTQKGDSATNGHEKQSKRKTGDPDRKKLSRTSATGDVLLHPLKANSVPWLATLHEDDTVQAFRARLLSQRQMQSALRDYVSNSAKAQFYIAPVFTHHTHYPMAESDRIFPLLLQHYPKGMQHPAKFSRMTPSLALSRPPTDRICSKEASGPGITIRLL
ncbi:Ubiquitin carboxyl-terminal hydrolase 21 [Diplonema papillatum]|nr:Ubiquitin carboxyl-terminal hydrolase 21 [Diplonema papillatum]